MGWSWLEPVARLYCLVGWVRVKQNEVTKMDEKQTNNETIHEEAIDWLKQEEKQLDEQQVIFDKVDGLILEEGKLTEFEIIVGDKPFEVWTDTSDENKVVNKVIIPVLKDGKQFNFWLNKRNPTYREIIKELATGKRKFRILRTGQRKQTKYQLVN